MGKANGGGSLTFDTGTSVFQNLKVVTNGTVAVDQSVETLADLP